MMMPYLIARPLPHLHISSSSPSFLLPTPSPLQKLIYCPGCCTTCTLFFFYTPTRQHQSTIPHSQTPTPSRPQTKKEKHTFHPSISSCRLLYCFTSSSSVFLSPSWFVSRMGTTSATERSVSTPLIMRKHFLSPGRGVRVSRTSLWEPLARHWMLGGWARE